jgi:O-succinylbenzoate synthase
VTEPSSSSAAAGATSSVAIGAPSLRLARLELREVRMPLKAPFETSFGRMALRRILIVRAFDRDGAFGYGECTAPSDPFYSPETIDTAWHVTTDFIGPLLERAMPAGAAAVGAALAPIREHRMAKAGVETAIWDLEARLAGAPLWRHLGGTRPSIDCGVSIGLQETAAALVDQVAGELASGYQRIKIKIKPGQDIQLVEAIRARFPAIALSVDANSAYSLDRDLALFERLDLHRLVMIEQPLAAGDLVDHAKLQRALRTPICLDESIVSLASARHAHELGACRILNIKLGRVGGHGEARAIQELASANGIPAWCGGMLESGIGRAHNIAMATLPGFTLPGDVSASARYFAEDVIDPPVTVSKEGRIAAPSTAGIGYAVDEARLEAMTVRRAEITL